MILVTGATGFLGTELIRQLTKQDIRIKAIKRTTSDIPLVLQNQPAITWITADLNEPETLAEALEGVTAVYHCAAFISFDPRDKKKLFHVNIGGTANMVNLCLEYGIRLLHVSSVAALGDAKKGELITEKTFWEYDQKTHAYGISKYESEMEVWRGIAEGLDAVIVNPSMIIGKHAGFEGSGSLFKVVRDGLQFFTNGATGVVDVEDVAETMIRLMNSAVTGERFIISSENWDYQKLFSNIASQMGVKAPTREAKPWMLGIAWRAARIFSWFSGKSPALTRETARSSFNESFYSNQKITQTLSYHFKPVQQSIEEICQVLKSS